jgi:SAM-dependent methyltransferase
MQPAPIGPQESISATAKGDRTVLHVGCGRYKPQKLHATFREPGWREIRLDIDPEAQPDIVTSMVSMPMVPTASVDAVWSAHNLEHLFAHEVPRALAEFLRVLKPGGFALITLPDLQAISQLIADDKLDEPAYTSAAGPVTPLDMLYGYRPYIALGNVFMAHRTGFTAKTLGNALIAAGFAKVHLARDAGYALWAEALKAPVAHGKSRVLGADS